MRARLCDQPGCQREATFACEWGHHGCCIEEADLCGAHALARTAQAEYSSITARFVMSREDVETGLTIGRT